MTRDEALKIVGSFGLKQLPGTTQEFVAVATLEGYEQGVRDSADKADLVLKQIKSDTGYTDNFQGEAVETVRNKILALLEKK